MAATTCVRVLWGNCMQRCSYISQRLPCELRCMVTTTLPCNAVDPPRRPAPSFCFFFKSKQEEIVRNNPDILVKDQAKIAGQLWRELDSTEKQRFQQEGLERFAEYKRQYQIYINTLTPSEVQEITEKKKQRKITLANKRKKREWKRLGKPLRPRNSFSLFLKSSKLERGEADAKTFLKGLVEYWKMMPEEEKQIYYHDADIDRERYDKEMAVWEGKMKQLGREDLIRNGSKTKPPRKKRTVLAKKKKVVSKKKKNSTKRKPQTTSKSTQTEDN